MGWPYTTQWFFGDGTDDGIGAETDAGTPNQLDVAHYTELARFGMTPYTGAYSMRVVLNGAAEVAYIADADAAMATGETTYFGFALYLSPDFALGSSNTIDIWELLDGGTLQAAIRLKDVSGTLTFAVHNDTGGTDEVEGTGYTVPIGEWMWVEGLFTAGGSSLLTLFVTRESETVSEQVATTAAGNDVQPAPDSVRLGVPINASTGNAGTILFDAYHWHDPLDDDGSGAGNAVGRVSPPFRNWEQTVNVHVPRHVFVGPGQLTNLTMISGSATIVEEVRVYDTDRAEADPERLKTFLHNTAADEVVDVANAPIDFQFGCYVVPLEDHVVLSGDVDDVNCRAIAQIAPRYWGSRSQIVRYGLTRPPI